MHASTITDHGNSSWRLEILEQILNPDDSNEVQNLPLLNVAESDVQIWKLTKDGNYFVKSAYHNIIDTLSLDAKYKADAKYTENNLEPS